MLSIATFTVFAQERVVKGQVVDETGEPVMGATVVVEGSTSNGVITDIDGNYTITISGFFVKFGGNLFFISPVFFFLNPIKSCRYVCFLVTLKTPHH